MVHFVQLKVDKTSSSVTYAHKEVVVLTKSELEFAKKQEERFSGSICSAKCLLSIPCNSKKEMF